mgnify:CR=1 FL=1
MPRGATRGFASGVDLAPVFKQFDYSGDGFLQIDELKRAFRAIGLQKRSGEKYDIDQKMLKFQESQSKINKKILEAMK